MRGGSNWDSLKRSRGRKKKERKRKRKKGRQKFPPTALIKGSVLCSFFVVVLFFKAER